MHMLSAVHYIFNRAKHLAENYYKDDKTEIPTVINFSYGWSGGRHDGQDYLEAAIGELIDARRQIAPTAIVMPSGNVFDENLHGIINCQDFKNNQYEFGWQLQPDDRTSSYLEIWFPDDTDDEDFTICLSHPFKFAADDVIEIVLKHNIQRTPDIKRRFDVISINGKIIGQISVDKHRDTRWRCLIALAPTSISGNSSAGANAAPAGKWKINIVKKANGVKSTKAIHCYVQRDDDPAIFKTDGRQSRLVDFKSPPVNPNPIATSKIKKGFVQNFGTLSGVSNHNSTTLVAGFDAVTNKPADYSSAGNISNIIEDKKVNISAILERSPSQQCVLAAGVKSRSLSILNGTSSAAPLVTRELAKKFYKLAPTLVQAQMATNYVGLFEEKIASAISESDGIFNKGNDENITRLGNFLLSRSYIYQP
ncbi:MAG: hypothetical protein COB24_03945 [Hyphomicrobiales bacterium]|nr:MAG: hypothetical protein COB24_03945 [Hyphomicrobiales bacterium]